MNGYVLVWEEDFLFSFFNDKQFLQKFHYLKSDRSSPFLQFDEELYKRVCHLLSQMMDEIHATKEIDHHVLRAMLYETLMLFNRAETTDSNTQQINLAFAIRYIDSFAKQANLDFAKQHDVEYYADKLCITSNYLNKIVRQSLGVTTKIYIRNKIISEAKRLLIYTTMSVTEITDKLHFESDSYFIRYFRKYVGVTPIQYRKQESK